MTNRFNLLLYLVYLMLTSISTDVLAQTVDSVITELDSISAETIESQPEYEYWKPRYYDSIPILAQMPIDTVPPYAEMLSRYQSKDFEYVESISEQLNFWDELIERFTRFLDSLFPQPNVKVYDGFYTILGILGGIIFLFLLYKLFFSGKKVYVQLPEEKLDEEEEMAFVERNLMQVDLHHYIREALQKGNYAMAIRYQQLLNIQILHEKGYIHWKHTKTNVELMEDVAIKELKEEFLTCATLFDRVWFGDRKILGQEYTDIERYFKQFQQKWS